MASYVELPVEQGATFSAVINIADDTNSAYINISGYSFSSQMRKSYYSANTSAVFSCNISNALAGEVTLSLSASNTANLDPGRYLFDLRAQDPQNNIIRLLEGTVVVSPQVTRG